MQNASRRQFLSSTTMATGALLSGPVIQAATTLIPDSPELASLRQACSAYATQFKVKQDTKTELAIVCEIGDLDKFSKAISSLVPEGTATQVNGNMLQFTHHGRQVQIEHVWNP